MRRVIVVFIGSSSLRLPCSWSLSSTLGAAQQTVAITGLVSDQTGASVAGAKVELARGPVVIRSVVTDRDGRYRLDDPQPGAYTVRVTAPGFQIAERQMNVAASGPAAVADFRLAVQTLEESVLVTAERVKAEVETQRALTPGGVTVVEGAELYQRHVANLADMLRFVPGVFAESAYGNDELFFSSRGSNLDAVDYDKNGVKLLQDGLPVTTADGNNHNRVIDPVDRPLRQRGPRGERADLRRQHAGWRHRFHIAHRPQQRAAVSRLRRWQFRFAERPRHPRRGARQGGRTPDRRRPAVRRLSRSQRAGAIRACMPTPAGNRRRRPTCNCSAPTSTTTCGCRAP